MAPKAGFKIHGDIDPLKKELQKARHELRSFNQDAIKSATGVKSLEQSSAQASQKVGLLKTSFAQLTGALIGANVIMRVAGWMMQWGKEILSTSSAMQELDSKARVVFGDSFPQVEERVKSIASEVGRARSAILQFAADFGAVIDAAGLTREATSAMSTEFSKLAVDLASFHNTSDVEAFNALRSAITGELEPLKRFGVVMTQANLQAYALDKGIKQKVETMSQAQLTALRYNYILDRTQTAQGDAARTAGSYANQARRLDGELQELNEELGKSGTPVLASGLAVLNSVLQNVRLFVGLLIQDIQSLFALLNVKVGGSSMGSTVKSAISRAVGSVPIIGPALQSAGKLLSDRVGNRISDAKAADSSNVGPLALPSLDEMMKQYSAKGAGAGGGGADTAKKAAEELAKAQEEVLQAMSEEAKINLENIRLRREDLLLRQKLGILTREEEQELQRINGRLEFKSELIQEATNDWEDQVKAIEQVEEKIGDVNEKIKEERKELQATLAAIDKDGAAERIKITAKLVQERKELDDKIVRREGLSEKDQARLAELDGLLSTVDKSLLDEGTRVAGLNEYQQLEEDQAGKKSAAEAKSQALIAELQAELDVEQKKLEGLKTAEAEKKAVVVAAMAEHLSLVDSNYAAELARTKAHTNAMISEYNRLAAARRAAGGMTIPAPASPGAAPVTTNNSQTINVNQTNTGDAARAAADPRGIRWTLRKQA